MDLEQALLSLTINQLSQKVEVTKPINALTEICVETMEAPWRCDLPRGLGRRPGRVHDEEMLQVPAGMNSAKQEKKGQN